MDTILLYPIFIPIAAGIACLLLPGRARILRQLLSLATTAGLAGLAVYLFTQPDLVLTIPWVNFSPNLVVAFDLRLTAFSRLILVVAAAFALLATLYSWAFMAGHPRHNEYYAYLLAALGAAAGAVLTDNLVILLFFWELLGFLLYLMTTINGELAIPSATKTLIIAGVGDLALLAGVALLWLASGSLSLSEIASRPLALEGWLPVSAFVLVMLGTFAKGGVFPLHTWIPEISLHTPLSMMAYFTALDKLTGIYLLARLALGLFALNEAFNLLLMSAGTIAIVSGVLMAMAQHDLRRMLAFHSISQVGYMVLGIGTGTPVGIIGGVFHLVNMVIVKGCLYLCGGSVQFRTRRTRFDELGGLAGAMPWTFASTLVVALSIAGVPPLNAFVSKWLIYQGILGWQGPLFPVFLAAAMFGSALTLASFVKLLYALFWGERARGLEEVKESPATIVIPLAALALASLLLGVFYRWPVYGVIGPILGPTQAELLPGGVWDAELAAILIGASLLVGLAIYFAGRVGESQEAEVFLGGEIIDPEVYRVRGTHFYGPVKEMSGLKTLYALGEAGVFDIYNLGRRAGDFLSRMIYKYIDQALSDFYQEVIPSLLSLVGQILRLLNTRLVLTREIWLLYAAGGLGILLLPGNENVLEATRVVACIGMIGWGVLAWVETDLKRLLLLAATSQFGFVLLGSTLSQRVALSYLVTGGIGLLVLYLCVRSISRALKTSRIERMGGLAGRMPGRFLLFLIGALWLSGLPPFGSFFSKYLLGMAASEFSPVLTIIITGTAIITLGYLLRPIRSFLRIA